LKDRVDETIKTKHPNINNRLANCLYRAAVRALID